MKLSSSIKSLPLLAAGLLMSGSAMADNTRLAMFVSETPSAQEEAALDFFRSKVGGTVLTPSTLSSLSTADFDALWVHIDRCAIGMGFANLPEEYKGILPELDSYVKAGGNLYLSKQATQMLAETDRLDSKFQVNIFGDGDGGMGSDDWTINACIGTWQMNPDNNDPDLTQVYDHRAHEIFAGLQVHGKEVQNYPHESFPMEGTGDPTTSMHREDHNCCWDLNPFAPLYVSTGKNTVEQWEQDTNSTVLATWGHVQDYCVAGIVEFAPAGDYKGTVIANGLAACEWAPRQGGNVYHANLEALTQNTLNYLAKMATGLENVSMTSAEPVRYFSLQGVEVSNPEKGIYVKIQGNKISKVVVK